MIMQMTKFKHETVNSKTGERYFEKYNPYEERLIYKNSNYHNPNSTIYADRMRQWDYEKYCKCSNDVFGYTCNTFDGTSSEDAQKFISMYLGHEITLVSAYMNKGYDGYYYYRFDYFDSTKHVDEITINI